MAVVETLKQAVDDFNNIKDALNYVGFSVNDDPTSTYGDKIKTLKSELDKVNNVTTQISNLTTQINNLETQINDLNDQNVNLNNTIVEDNNNFDDIYDAIVYKGSTPVKEEHNTYAQAIRDIEGGSDNALKINSASYLFYSGTRREVMDELLDACENVTNWDKAFYQCPIPNGKRIVADLTHIYSDSDNTRVFEEIYPENNNAEITCVVNSNKYFRLAFSKLDSTKKLGVVNIEIHDKSNGGFTTIEYLFYQANNVKSILMDADCSNVVNLKEVFYQFNYNNITNAIHELDISSWGIKWDKVTNIYRMFYQSRYLTSINLGENVVIGNIDAWYAFAGCISLKSINLDIKDTKVVSAESYRNFFDSCNVLENIEYTDKWVIYNCTQRMFINCYNLVDIPPIELHICSTNMHNTTEWMYEKCTSAKEIYIDIIYEDSTYLWCQYTFLNCTSLEYVRGNFDMSAISNTSNGIFSGCKSLKCIETSGSLGGRRTDVNLTLDLSASAVFEIENFLNNLATNESGKTHTIKLHSTVYDSLTDNVKNLAASKNYALSK